MNQNKPKQLIIITLSLFRLLYLWNSVSDPVPRYQLYVLNFESIISFFEFSFYFILIILLVLLSLIGVLNFISKVLHYK